MEIGNENLTVKSGSNMAAMLKNLQNMFAGFYETLCSIWDSSLS